jgi:hypothetical protein
MRKRLWVAYDPPHDLHDLIMLSGIPMKLIAKVCHHSERILRYRLAGYYRMPDELALYINDFLNFPDEFRPFPVQHRIKLLMKKHDVGMNKIASYLHMTSRKLWFILEGYAYIGGPCQEKFILDFIKTVYLSRSPDKREWIHLCRLQRRSIRQKERLKLLWSNIFTKEVCHA